jgi:hypothetical protein
MMSRKTDPERIVKKLEKSIQELSLDLKAIIDEHDQYCWPSHEHAAAWFESLPIETLRESVEREHGEPRHKMSLHDLKHKFGLRRLHEKTQAKLEQKERDLRVVRYEQVIREIERILG